MTVRPGRVLAGLAAYTAAVAARLTRRRSGQGNLVVQTFKPLLLALLYGQVLVWRSWRGAVGGGAVLRLSLAGFRQVQLRVYVFHPFAIFVARRHYLALGSRRPACRFSPAR